MQLTITAVADTSAYGCGDVYQWLREYNMAANPSFMMLVQQPEHAPRPLVLLASANDETVGGLFAETQLSWLRISIVAVDPTCHAQGIGTALLTAAEQEAVRRGCKHAYVDTMEYQAPRFYVERGYSVVGKIDDWDSHGYAKFYLTKSLAVGKDCVGQIKDR